MGFPHDVPTAPELVESVREWLERDVVPGAAPVNRFDARVAANVLAIVERELELGAAQDRRHRDRLEQLGVDDDKALAKGIREGRFDDRLAEVRRLVWESVRDKLAVANPRYVDRSEQRTVEP